MEIRLKSSKKKNRMHAFFRNPMRIIASSFLLIIITGTLLLMLPVASQAKQGTSFLTALFTATSATCITGMFLMDLANYWSVFGQIVIILLIQLGGLGLVTITTFFNLALRKKLGFQSLYLAKESINTDQSDQVSALIFLIMRATLLLEFIGGVLLAFVFVPEYGWGQGLYCSFFMAISAYCNAGVDILGNSGESLGLIPYANNPLVLVTIVVLAVVGGLGFVVWYDLFLFRKTKRLLLHTKIVVLSTVVLILGGMIAFLSSEWSNLRTIGTFSTGQKILNGLFFSVSCRTSGFATFPIEGMNDMSRMFTMLLMFIGAAPGSTGGGIKLTTFIVLLMTTVSVVRGRDETVILGRKIDRYTVYKALAVTMLSVAICVLTTCVISFTFHGEYGHISFGDALFETVAAYSTTGFSVGVVNIANTASRVLLGFLMFLGRLGPVTLAFSLTLKAADHKSEVLPEGKILVG